MDNKDLSREVYDVPTDDYNADDLDCAVCADVLVDPCTLGCGHNFCESVFNKFSRIHCHWLC